MSSKAGNITWGASQNGALTAIRPLQLCPPTEARFSLADQLPQDLWTRILGHLFSQGSLKGSELAGAIKVGGTGQDTTHRHNCMVSVAAVLLLQVLTSNTVSPQFLPSSNIDCMQLATVCRSWAHAVAGLMATKEGLDVNGDVSARQLACKMLLTWAPNFRRLFLSGSALSQPRLRHIVAAASGLWHVSITCDTADQAAEADFLFAESTTISWVVLHGAELPCVLPLSTEDIYVDFDAHSCDERDNPALQWLHPFLCRLVRLRNLSTLHLNIAGCHHMPSTMQLPALESLTVSMRTAVYEGGYDLAWLTVQNYSELHIAVWVYRAKPSDQMLLIEDIIRKQLVVTSIRLIMRKGVPVHDQLAWAGLATELIVMPDFFITADEMT